MVDANAVKELTEETEHSDRDSKVEWLKYLAVYLFTFIYWEVILRLRISGKITAANLPGVFLLPAAALFFTVLSGFHRKHKIINRIVMMLLLVLAGLYYFVQFVYFGIFGSVLSVSMIGMGGDAMNNFGWSVGDAVISSLGGLCLILIPIVIMAHLLFVRFRFNKGRNILGGAYPALVRIIIFALIVPVWFLGIGCIRLGGAGRGSAYYVIHDATADTDTTATRVGILPTTIIETGAYYFGFGSGKTAADMEVDIAAINITSAEDEARKAEEEKEAQEEAEKEKEVVREPYVDEAIDFEKLATLTGDPSIASLCKYYNSKSPTTTNEYTGLFEGYNLIYICGEAFSGYGIDPDITPLLYEMSQNGIVLNNYYNSFPNTTTNGEFAFATSLWPDVSRIADSGTAVGTFAQSANVFMPYGLGDLLNANGINSYAYHNYYGDYYKRAYSWPNLGYENIKFMDEGMKFTSTWPASDLELFEQSVDDYIDDDQFHAYYMTFSGHGPYKPFNQMYKKNIEAVRELAGDKYESDGILGYFCGEYELEQGLQYLVDRLKEKGKLDKTVIVIAGDHFPYFLDEQSQKELVGDSFTDQDFQDFEKYHATCIIYNAGLKEKIETDTYCCNVDIVPTMLNLMNIKFDSRLLAGTDIFSDGVHRARLYNGSFITDKMKYNRRTGVKVWTDGAGNYTEDAIDAYEEAMISYTESEYSASLQALRTNFFFYVWKNSGLMTDEEIYAENIREQDLMQVYEMEAQIEAAKQAEEQALAIQQAMEAAGMTGENGEGADGTEGADTAGDGGTGDAGDAGQTGEGGETP